MMTKKQIKALSDISANGKFITKQRRYGEGKYRDGYFVTDGCVVVFYPESVPELADGATMGCTDSFFNIFDDDLRYGSYHLVQEPFFGEVNVSTIRKIIKEYTIDHKSVHTAAAIKSIDLSARLDDGTVVAGRFNTKYLINAIEAVGSKPLVYIGYSKNNRRYPCLMLCSEDTMWDTASGCCAMVMPIRTN